jgi:diaminopimelate epimerase
MKIHFSKMQALGNDFVVIDAINQTVSLTPQQIQQIADRRLGIGCDQVLLVESARDPQADFFYRIFNVDGSEAEQCGNGARCFTRFLVEHKLSSKTHFILQTRSGLMSTELLSSDKIRVNLGTPIFSPSAIPFLADEPASHYQIDIAQQTLTVGVVSVGNPHAVLLVDDVNQAHVSQYGAALETDVHFPNRVNVEFMEIINPQKIALRVWERGVGETPACGSGACAAVIIGRSWKLLDPIVTVTLPGGTLLVEYQDPTSSVFLTGNAEQIFTGVYGL